MTLPLTPATLEAAYEYLRTTPPFSAWSLPEGDEIKFTVSRSRKWFARYGRVNGKHAIEVSANSVGHGTTLMTSLGHEMVHLHLEELGMDRRGTTNTHSGAFRRLAEEVCKMHGWDLKAFY